MAKTRRSFLATAAIAAPAAAQTSRSRERVRGANDVIGVGIIGMGGITQGHVRVLKGLDGEVRINAVCDIYKPRLDRAVDNTGAKGYHAYEDLLSDPNVDAVIVATPDHWHAQMAIDAMRAGKDVNVEKPMALTIAEAKEMVRVADETGRVLSIDSEHMAHGIWEPAKQAIAKGVLGKLVWSQTSRATNSAGGPWNYAIDEGISPENLDWERWLGSAPKVAFDPERFFRWRRYFDYGGGIATDLFTHHVTPLIEITGREFPIRATAAGGHNVYSTEMLEVPDTHIITLDFPTRHSMVVAGSLANATDMPIVVRGHEATLAFHGPDQRRPASFTIEAEAAHLHTLRDKVRAAGLESEGEWREQRRRTAPPRLDDLMPQRRETRINGLLGIPKYQARYDDDLRKNPNIASDEGARLDYFTQLFSERNDEIALTYSFSLQAKPTRHYTEHWLEAIRTRGTVPLPGELGYRAHVATSMGVEALRRDKVMHFDTEREELVERS